MPGPLPTLSAAELSRYSRHLLLPEIGTAGQQRLAASRVIVIGAGGLGSPAAYYLAAAGIGTLGLADFDRVEEHNLQRQILHDTASVGTSKVQSAIERLARLNPHVRLVPHEGGITAANAVEVFSNYDVVVDGTDNFSARYLNNDAAFFARKPLVHASVFTFSGQITVFDPTHGGPCYRCLFPQPPAIGSVPGCGEAGVLGALCGVMGSLQALETIKLIANIGEPLVGRLLTYDALTQRFETLALSSAADCPLCGRAPTIRGVDRHGAAGAAPATDTSDLYPPELSVREAQRRLQHTNALLVDVREPWETEICRVTAAAFIPMRDVASRIGELPRDRHLLVLCHHGARSRNVTEFLRKNGFETVSNVAGGIAAWANEIDPAMQRY